MHEFSRLEKEHSLGKLRFSRVFFLALGFSTSLHARGTILEAWIRFM
jgi:hypothetical protein